MGGIIIMSDATYLKALTTYAVLITANNKTVADVPLGYITGGAKGVINGSYPFEDIPMVLQEAVKARILELDPTFFDV